MAANGVRRLVVLNLEQEVSSVLSVDNLAHGLAGDHELAELLRSLPEGGPRPS